MRNIYTIENWQFVHNELHLSLNENENKIQIQPAGKVITDSDQLALIYLVEENEEYSYIQFPQNTWSSIVEGLKSEKNPTLVLGDQHIELVEFNEELTMLLFNIEGNDNYGKEFVEAIETAFAEILKEQ
ncbi:hypothetical protein D1B33_03115 [Lysinibacillus yapensis]|uniref:Uncharacterized protein n=1 Tax=Ureibacillus yapensis TaxID=2304605 RepID=A0A396SLF6_9BACL|nr:hypothetical protein [Lysinibacillus yapensis]RHW39857.1 hypothetical protein D1B33_03115 [Lysinibacillus yapensis]